MDFINLSASMTMLDLVRYLIQDTNNSFSFYSGNLSTSGEVQLANNSQLLTVCQYICKKIREDWNVHNIGITVVGGGEFMICVTSPEPNIPAEVVTIIVEAVAACIDNLVKVNPKNMTVDGIKNCMEEDIPPDLIQVNATMKEINERIEQFISYKRSQANANNVLDFCGPPSDSQLCARVDAILVRKKDSSSHMAVRNVLDRYTSKDHNEKPAPVTMSTLKGHIEPSPGQVIPSHTENQTSVPYQKGDKRTYDVASLESMLSRVKKQQKS